MNQHLPILPIILPMATAVALVLMRSSMRSARRWLSLSSMVMQGAILATLGKQLGEQGPQAYFLGGWDAPFGIALLVDHLSLWMLWVTWALAGVALVYACRGGDGRTRQFHALFHFQLMGIYGAFLTADLFNLFVFFEVLLIASYALLAHGGGADRIRASLHYVTLNLVGSSIFLIALGMLYAALGTLNMADLSVRMEQVSGSAETLARAGGYLLLVVFGLKAALVPMYAWLPRTYAAASGAVAALFVIMTKVGFYAILRVFTLLYGDQDGPLSGLADTPLFVVAMLTLMLGAIGALAASGLMRFSAWLVLVSTGTLLAAVAMGGADLIASALFYLAHTTFATATLFLLADFLRERCGEQGDVFAHDSLPSPSTFSGIAFLVAAVAVVGLPPLSGFFAKARLLVNSLEHPWGASYWVFLLVVGFTLLIACSRAGSSLFWRRQATENGYTLSKPDSSFVLIMLLLFAFLLVLSLGQAYFIDLAGQAANDLLDVEAYRTLLLSGAGGTAP